MMPALGKELLSLSGMENKSELVAEACRRQARGRRSGAKPIGAWTEARSEGDSRLDILLELSAELERHPPNRGSDVATIRNGRLRRQNSLEPPRDRSGGGREKRMVGGGRPLWVRRGSGAHRNRMRMNWNEMWRDRAYGPDLAIRKASLG